MEAEGDDYLTTLLRCINLKNATRSDRDTMNLVLFGDVDGIVIDGQPGTRSVKIVAQEGHSGPFKEASN